MNHWGRKAPVFSSVSYVYYYIDTQSTNLNGYQKGCFKMNFSTANQEIIFSTINSYKDNMSKKYKEDPEECEFELDKHKATFILFSNLDSLFSGNFKFKCDMMMVTDDSVPDKTIIAISYVNKDSQSGYTYSELPEDSITIGWVLEENHIDINMGHENCAYIDVMGPTVILPAFNEAQFKSKPLFNTVTNNIWKAVTDTTTKMMEPTPRGSTALDVTENINKILRKWIDDCEDENLKSLRYAFCAMIESVEDVLFEAYDCFTGKRYVVPNDKEIEPRYITLYLMEKDGHYIKEGIDLAQLPDTICMEQFSIDDRQIIEVSLGNSPIVTIWIKENKPRIRFDSVEDELKTEKYEEIISKIKEKYSECFESN